MSSECAVSVRGLSKCYAMFSRPQDRLVQMLSLGRKKLFREHWALRDVSFDVPRGQTVGVIGRNGSGKSTLLQLIAGTLEPSAGSVSVTGRVSALLELGSGFNPEFSGTDNIFLSGAVLGMSRQEIESKFDLICAFADIGPFLDQPAKTYSSGMYMRLAFAVAASLEPDVLIVDEALSVGDAKFQAKCFRRFEEFQANGGTVLLVTHSTEQIVRHCSSAVLLEGGAVLQQGEPRAVVNRYLDLLFGVERTVAAPPADNSTVNGSATAASLLFPMDGRLEQRPNYNQHEYRWGSRTAEILDCMVMSGTKTDVIKVDIGERLDFYMKVHFSEAVQRPIYGITIKTPDGVTVFGTNSRDWDGKKICQPRARNDGVVIHFSIPMNVGAGEYLVSLGVAEDGPDVEDVTPLDRRYDALYLTVFGELTHSGLAFLPATISLVEPAVNT